MVSFPLPPQWRSNRRLAGGLQTGWKRASWLAASGRTTNSCTTPSSATGTSSATASGAREDVLRRVPSANRLIVTFERNNVPLTQAATQARVIDPLGWRQQRPDGRSEITRHELRFDEHGFVAE